MGKPHHHKHIHNAMKVGKAVYHAYKAYKSVSSKVDGKSERGQGDVQMANTVNATKVEWVRGHKKGKKSFAKKVEQAIAHAVAPKQLLTKGVFTITSGAGTQAYSWVSILGGALNATDPQTGDLGQLFVSQDTTNHNNILYTDHATLDLTLWFNSASVAAVAVVDIYELSTKRDTNIRPNIWMDFDATQSDIVAGTVANTPFPSSAVGYTPFNSPSLCKMYTINSKRTCLLSAAVPMETIRLSDHKTRKFAYDQVSQVASVKRATKGYLIVVHGSSASATATSVAQYPTATVNINYTKNFNVRVLKDSQMETGTTLNSI